MAESFVPFYFDEEVDNTPTQPITVEQKPQQNTVDSIFSKEFISNKLETIGIKDINSIKFEEDNGNIITKSFYDLTEEERLNILSPQMENTSDSGFVLNDKEKEFIENARKNKELDSYIKEINEAYLQNYLQENPTQTDEYNIDDYSDEQLFFADMRIKSPYLTDQEILDSLEKVKQDEERFKTTIDNLRKYYKEEQERKVVEEKTYKQEQARLEAERYNSGIKDAISKFTDFSELEIEDIDRSELLDILTNEDTKTGRRKIEALLQDPKNLVLAAWAILKGENSVNELASYYKKLLTESRKNQFEEKPTVFVKPNNFSDSSNNREKSGIDINDLNLFLTNYEDF